MRLTDITEKSRQSVTLFRGDSSMIDDFDMDKTDASALVGRGVYLTTSFDVAKDYTIKGTDVLYRSEEGEANDPRGFIYNVFFDQLHARFKHIAQAYQYAIQGEVSNMDRVFSDEIDQIVGTGRAGQQHPRYGELNSWKNKAYRYATPYAMAAGEKILLGYLRSIYDEEYAKFKASFKGTRMLTTVLGELIIIPEDKLGHVSRFRAPKKYLEGKFYQVDEPMSDEDLVWIVQQLGKHRDDFNRGSTMMGFRYNDDDGEEQMGLTFDGWIEKFKSHGARYAWGDYNVGGEGKNPTLMQFANGTHIGQSIVAGYNSTFWDDFREHLVQQGMSGIHYAGGTRTGSNTYSGGSATKHDVYVMWDPNEVRGLRVGTKEVGMKTTDQRLFSRFKFPYVAKSLVSDSLARHGVDAKRMRKDVKNVERIEAAIQEWFKTGELQQAMEKADASTKDT